MKVLKFGGTSVGSAERIKNVAELVNDSEEKIVVLSAMSGTTNALVEIGEYLKRKNRDGAVEQINALELKYETTATELLSDEKMRTEANELIKNRFNFIRSLISVDFGSNEEKAVLAQGELLSTNLFYLYTQQIGIESVLISALDFMKIDENGEPDSAFIATELTQFLKNFTNKSLIITQGFICKNESGEIDNLKRGGSDYSASLIGAAIGSSEIQIWTDIDGVHNNDPRFVDNTKAIAELSFDEAAELAYFGAKVLHPLSVLPAKMRDIPVYLKNTLCPEAAGTKISNNLIESGIKAVAAKDGLTAIKIKSSRMFLAYGFMRKIFEVFEKYKTPIDMVTTSEVAVSLTIDDTSNLTLILDELMDFGSVAVDENQTIICIVGNMIAEEKGHAVTVLQALEDISVRMISYGGSRHNISLLIDTDNKQQALSLLHKNLF